MTHMAHTPSCPGCQIIGLIAERDALQAKLDAAASHPVVDREFVADLLLVKGHGLTKNPRKWLETVPRDRREMMLTAADQYIAALSGPGGDH